MGVANDTKDSESRYTRFYTSKGTDVICSLCPKNCTIKDGARGICLVRKNIGGKMISEVYGKLAAIHIDPIEKKPLFHFMPGTNTFSIGTNGCNMKCKNCQNYDISQRPLSNSSKKMLPDNVVKLAKKNSCRSISYTYNDPIVFTEMVIETAKIAKANGLANIMVTNGYINKEPLLELLQYVDAFSVDLKSIDENFYKNICNAELDPVKKTLVLLKNANKHIEITNLLIPGLNDSIEQVDALAKWIADKLGKKTPLHISKFFPDYRLRDLPPTPAEVMIQAAQTAKKHLDYVYIGNMTTSKGANTYCPRCGRLLVGRSGFGILVNKLHLGKCRCKKKIYGVWNDQ